MSKRMMSICAAVCFGAIAGVLAGTGQAGRAAKFVGVVIKQPKMEGAPLNVYRVFEDGVVVWTEVDASAPPTWFRRDE